MDEIWNNVDVDIARYRAYDILPIVSNCPLHSRLVMATATQRTARRRAASEDERVGIGNVVVAKGYWQDAPFLRIVRQYRRS